MKGKIDATPIKMIALIPMGQGNFIMPVKADLRKLLGKKHGMHVEVELQIEKEEVQLDSDFVRCLEEDPAAKRFSLKCQHRTISIIQNGSRKPKPKRPKPIASPVALMVL
ncbi:MAG: DUF1905 domain-containing protein [Bacteroidetes bacterium]|nr:DUF1905 domain-containing protein [Bacteroidota bacterium]